MLVDPVTIIAQAVNFLVLVLVLKLVLYDRVVAVIDQRQTRIRAQQDAAAALEATADRRARSLERQQADLRRDRDALLDDAREEAERYRTDLYAREREEIDELRHRWHAGLDRQRGRLLTDLERHSAHELVAISQQMMTELADADLEHQVVRAGLDRLEELSREISGVAVFELATSFELGGDERDEVSRRLQALAAGAPLRFVVDEALVCGFELRAGDHAYGWNVASWLEALRDGVDDFLDEQLGEVGATVGQGSPDSAGRSSPGDAQA